MKKLKLLYKILREEGQGLAEYGLILSLIVFVALSMVSIVAGRIDEMYQYIWDKIGPL